MKISIEHVYDDLVRFDFDGQDGLVKIHDDEGPDDIYDRGENHSSRDPDADRD